MCKLKVINKLDFAVLGLLVNSEHYYSYSTSQIHPYSCAEIKIRADPHVTHRSYPLL